MLGESTDIFALLPFIIILSSGLEAKKRKFLLNEKVYILVSSELEYDIFHFEKAKFLSFYMMMFLHTTIISES